MLLPIISALLVSQSNSITLFRGAPIAGSETRYWSCEDTVLSREHSMRSYGQGLLVWLGKDKRTLLRFGDLQRALGPLKRVTKARLVLNAEQIGAPGTLKLFRFSAAWNEGAGTGESQPVPFQWATTWDFQFFNQKGKQYQWKNGGAEFESKTPSSTAMLAAGQKEIAFDGLASEVQSLYEKPYENYGWAIEFDGECAVNSAENGASGPRLEIEFESVAEKTGPDLSVVYVTRTPEYERYDNRGDAYVRANVGGHESGVMMKPGNADSKKWPADGEEVTYTAFVKNIGTSAASGCSYEWSANYEKAGAGQLDGPIAAGETKQIQFKTKFKNDHFDHRTLPVSIKVTPSGEDAVAANNFLEVQACALNIGIWVDEGFYKKFGEQVNGSGSRAFEDWIQWQFRIWNEVFMRQSRFSFAQDGSRETVRVGRITIVPNGTLKGGVHMPNDTPTLIYDGEWGFDSSFGDPQGYINAVRNQADRALIHEMSHQIGLIDLYWMNMDPSLPDGTRGKVRLKDNGSVFTRGAFDPCGGLMGAGDTRNETLIPAMLPIPQEETNNPVYRGPTFLPTNLYALTDVAALNSNLGFRRGFFGEFMYSMPNTVLVRAMSRDGMMIPDGKLSFYQMKNGEIADGPPDFDVQLKNGIAILPNRPTGLDAPFTTLTGHTLKPNPFGRTDVVGTNGVFLVRLDYQGQTEWAWLKAWQLVDAYYRGNKTIYIHELKFNVTTRPIKPLDWALKKTAIDKANSSGMNLANLLDGDTKTDYQASGEIGDWVEIDIGRDRPIGEIKLVISGDPKAFWNQFDILAYGTGETVSEARAYATELNWATTSTQRADIDPKDFNLRRIAYRGNPLAIRFIRIVNKSGGKGRLSGVEIREVDLGQ